MMMKQSALTKRQAEILNFIKTHIQYSGFPPTISEIQDQFSFKSPNAVQEHLKALVRKGQIRRNPFSKRIRKEDMVRAWRLFPMVTLENVSWGPIRNF
jgi:repressor LexA